MHIRRLAQRLAHSKSSANVNCCFPSLASTLSTRFPPAPFILFQGHAGGGPTSPSAPPKLRPSLLPRLVPERRSGGKSPVRSGGGGAHARAGRGGGGEEELPEVGGRGGGRAGSSCQGNRGAGRTAHRQAGLGVVSAPGTQEA